MCNWGGWFRFHLNDDFWKDAPKIFPCIGIDSRVEIDINFGSSPFEFSLDSTQADSLDADYRFVAIFLTSERKELMSQLLEKIRKQGPNVFYPTHSSENPKSLLDEMETMIRKCVDLGTLLNFFPWSLPASHDPSELYACLARSISDSRSTSGSCSSSCMVSV